MKTETHLNLQAEPSVINDLYNYYLSTEYNKLLDTFNGDTLSAKNECWRLALREAGLNP